MFVFKWLRRGKTDSRAPDGAPCERASVSTERGAAVDAGVLDLIGPAMASDAAALRTPAWTPAPDGARDLLQTLYAQYCGALDAPLAPFANEWAAQTARAPLPPPAAPAMPPGDAGRGDSIDALLSRARTIDEVLGLLGPADVPDPATDEPVPEILRLFAPAEHQAGHRAGVLPPALARREHQALAIDSPLVPPGATPEPRA